MKIIPTRRLFWFLKQNTSLDLSESSGLDLYVQQVLSRGGTGDVRHLLKQVPLNRLRQSFDRIKNFLPSDVKSFWETFLEDYQPDPRKHS